MAFKFTTSYLEDALSLFRHYKGMGEKAMAQVRDEDLYVELDRETNSIAIIVKHLAGNMRSRWTDFLTTDGEKPGRERDSEFVNPPATRSELLALWEEGWGWLFGALEPLTDADLSRTVATRGERHSVLQAINVGLVHYSYHVGQIVMLAKHFGCEHWQTLSVPRNQSDEFNKKVTTGAISQR